MKNLLSTICALLVLGSTSCKDAEKENEHEPVATDTTAAAPAEEKADEASRSAPPDSAAMAKAWQDYMTPGPMHKWMASADGKWEAEVRSCTVPGGPLGEPSKAKVENKMIFNGLYQESTYKGNMMGMPFEGKGIMAYDNAKKKIVSTWIDNMGTGILHMEGDFDEGSKTINLNGKVTDPMTGKESPWREVVKIVDDKNQVMEMYGDDNGKEYLMMQIKLARK